MATVYSRCPACGSLIQGAARSCAACAGVAAGTAETAETAAPAPREEPSGTSWAPALAGLAAAVVVLAGMGIASGGSAFQVLAIHLAPHAWVGGRHPGLDHVAGTGMVLLLPAFLWWAVGTHVRLSPDPSAPELFEPEEVQAGTVAILLAAFLLMGVVLAGWGRHIPAGSGTSLPEASHWWVWKLSAASALSSASAAVVAARRLA